MTSPADPVQFPLGATTSEAKMRQQIAESPLPGPGAIVARMGYQFQLPRAEPDAGASDNDGTPYG